MKPLHGVACVCDECNSLRYQRGQPSAKTSWASQPKGSKGRAMKTTKIESKVAVWAYKRGLKEGARQERRYTRKVLREYLEQEPAAALASIRGWLARYSLALRAKRMEGK